MKGNTPDFDFAVTLTGNPLSFYINKDYKCPANKESYEYKATGSSYFIYCPTYKTSLKHKNNRGTISKLYFSPKEGIVIVY